MLHTDNAYKVFELPHQLYAVEDHTVESVFTLHLYHCHIALLAEYYGMIDTFVRSRLHLMGLWSSKHV